MKIQVRQLGERGFEWVRAPGAKISNGLPRVRREPPTNEEVAAHREMMRQMQQDYYRRLAQPAYLSAAGLADMLGRPMGRSMWP
jgi:hypothetical protein